jgi:ABC-type glycerol-3-phosphate transport system substrate-binding protein
MATLALTTLGACGSDDADNKSADSGPETADIRVWLNGTDTPEEARDWLKTTFEDDHPGSTLTIEQQEWDGLVEKLTTSLSSASETPDVVEIGNTQAPTFTSAGAFSDVTDHLEDLGGDDLLQGFVDGATIATQIFRGAFDLCLIGGDDQIEIILRAFSGELKANPGRGSGYDGEFALAVRHGQAPLCRA